MDALGNGLVVLANGLRELLLSLANPLAIFGIVLVASLWWLATVEIESIGRTSIKPKVVRH